MNKDLFHCRERRTQLLNLLNAISMTCGESAAVTLTTLAGHLRTMSALIQLNGTADDCTDGKFTAVHRISGMDRRFLKKKHGNQTVGLQD